MDLMDVRYCYILDAILLLYGIILTVMYCRLRLHSMKEEPSSPKEKDATEQKPTPEGGIYAGLTLPNTDTYETIHVSKKPKV